MKKQIILKTFMASSLFYVSLSAASLSSTEIVNMVAEIKKERKGILLSKLETTANPFIINVPKKKEVTEVKEDVTVMVAQVVHTLKAILNKAAFIDNKWYKKGDKIGDYKIGYVSSSSVVLKSENGNKTLSLEKKKKKFIKLNRGYK
ncbi:MAG TPA: hypothetical protein EYG94_04735 [Campylobacterales bacterium]|nr:hypothetical protein [Campylobacterales bacterium]